MIEAIPGKVDPLLLPFIIQNDKFFDYAVSRSAGGLSPRVKWEHLKDYEFDLPPIEEQRILADKLWAAYRLKESYKKLLTATQEMVKSQFFEMFEGDEYPLIKLGDYTDLTWGDTNTTKNSYVTEGYLAYSASGPDGKLDHYDYDCEGIVLSAIGADCGKTWFASGKWSCIKNTIRFWSTFDDLDNRFLYFATREKDFWPRRGGAQPFIPQGDARNCSIPLPPICLQRKFVEIAEQADKSEFVGCKSQFIEMYYNTHNKQTLESVCPIMNKGITPKYVESSSVLVINQACIHWDGQRLGNIKYHNEEIPVRKRILESGDVLLNATGNGTLGRCCVFICPSDNNTYINDGHVIALSTDRAVILPEVLNTYLSLNDTQAEIYRQYVTGSTNQVDIVFSDIKKMKVPVPSMDEQILFVEVLTQADKSEYYN